jgi:hypothetical protein
MTNPPTLNGRVIGQAEAATRAVLDKLLADIGTSFLSWVTLNQLTLAGGRVPHDELVLRVRRGLKVDAAPAMAALGELLAHGHVRHSSAAPSEVEVTASGYALYERVQRGIDAVTARLYGDLPAEELATAARVLTILTERANAELG